MNQTYSEYVLLNNYQQNALDFRGLLITIDYTVLEQLENNRLILLNRGKLKPITFASGHKEKFQSAIQINIISKLMMYVEDLIIFMESFRRKTNFYNLLNNNEIDIGNVISSFIQNFEKLDNSTLQLILNYHDINKLDCNDEIKKILQKGYEGNYQEFRRGLKQIIDFGSTNHPTYRRYKHAGFPIFPAMDVPKNEVTFEKYERLSVVSTGNDPFSDVDYIPYSKDILDGYRIIYIGIRSSIDDLIKNRLVCIERDIEGMLPDTWYKPDVFTKEEFIILEKFFETFYTKHPKHQIVTGPINFSMRKDQDLKWYGSILDFLKTAKDTAKYESVEIERLGATRGGFGAENLCPLCKHDRKLHIKKINENSNEYACRYVDTNGKCFCTKPYERKII